MKKSLSLLRAAIGASVASALMSLAPPALAEQAKPGIERMYVLYCGDIALNDASSFTPGASGPGHLTVTCYLIKHARGWVLFDTGVGDHIFKMPDGQKSRAGNWTVKKTLESQLSELGLKPSDIDYLALSHSHGDHVGNLGLFSQSTLVVQKPEFEWKPPVGVNPFKPGMKAITPEGDHDLFGDGSVVLIATYGHSPGHQNLLVRLPKTGAVMLTGDSVHTKANWEGGRVPKGNFDGPQSLKALERMRAVLTEAKAELWIGHEPSEVSLRRYAPAYYE
jgi:glyoxylase-like metal-dependent hydrolase (beta-lactamase superfamily II)